MSRNGISGVLCGFLITALLTVAAVASITGDYDQGTIFCTAKDSQPVCRSTIASNSLVGYSFAPGSAPKDGDPLMCTLVLHNNWYFTWDNRGHGWHNERTYSYDNCMVGREA